MCQKKNKKSDHQSVSVQPLLKERPGDRQTSPLGKPTSLKLFLSYMPTADLHHTCLQLTPIIHAYSWLPSYMPTADSHHTCLQVTPSYMPASDSVIHACKWLHHTCLQVNPLYMPASDSIIHAWNWLHHTCLQVTPSYMLASDSIIHA